MNEGEEWGGVGCLSGIHVQQHQMVLVLKFTVVSAVLKLVRVLPVGNFARNQREWKTIVITAIVIVTRKCLEQFHIREFD
jgi:hypothetical protein